MAKHPTRKRDGPIYSDATVHGVKPFLDRFAAVAPLPDGDDFDASLEASLLVVIYCT